MNVQDFEELNVEGDMLDSLFEHQRALHEKYKPIEQKNGIGYAIMADREFDIDDRYSQAYLKDLSHRVIEELTESAEAYSEYRSTRHKGHFEHAQEEMIDALHFFIEYLIVVGIEPDSIPHVISKKNDKLETIWSLGSSNNTNNLWETHYWYVVQSLGTATNLLKQRPWKSSHIPTDTSRFHYWLIQAFHQLTWLMKNVGNMTPEMIYGLYTQKNQVNNWRIKSNY